MATSTKFIQHNSDNGFHDQNLLLETNLIDHVWIAKMIRLKKKTGQSL